MNRLYIIIACLFVTITTIGQNKGTDFKNIKFEEALKIAKKEKKFIFIDCYTEWCGPCKMMAQYTFTDKSVGDYMNSHFINLKYDVYKGEGKFIMNKFQPKCFPTYLILESNGEEIHRFSGQSQPKEFIEKLSKVFDPKNRLSTFHNKYKSGKFNADFILEYMEKIMQSGDYQFAGKLFQEYHRICAPSKRINTKSLKYYKDKYLNKINSETFRYLIYSKNEVEKKISQKELEDCIYSIYRYQLISYLNAYHLDRCGYDKNIFLNYKKDIKNVNFEKPNDLLILTNLAMKLEELPIDEYLEKLPDLVKGLDHMNKCYSITMFSKYKLPLNATQKDKILNIAKQFRKEATNRNDINSYDYFIKTFPNKN